MCGEIPPNGQGLIALLALNTLKGFSFDAKDSVDTYHKQIEAIEASVCRWTKIHYRC